MFVGAYNSLCYRLFDQYDYKTAPEIILLQGQSGMGKTAFLQYILEKFQKTLYRVCYLDAGAFSRKFAFLLQKGDISPYRKKLRSCDLLLIDNLHCLKGKKKSLEELFYTLQDVFARGGKAIITACSSNFSLSFLGERFSSRLCGALSLNLQNPTLSEKQAFAEHYCREHHILFDKMDFSPAWEKLNLKEIVQTLEHFRQGQSYQKKDMERDYRKYLAQVSKGSEITHEEIISKSKKKAVVRARQRICWDLHQKSGYSYEEIALFLGNTTNCIRQRCRREAEEAGCHS